MVVLVVGTVVLVVGTVVLVVGTVVVDGIGTVVTGIVVTGIVVGGGVVDGVAGVRAVAVAVVTGSGEVVAAGVDTSSARQAAAVIAIATSVSRCTVLARVGIRQVWQSIDRILRQRARDRPLAEQARVLIHTVAGSHANGRRTVSG